MRTYTEMAVIDVADQNLVLCKAAPRVDSDVIRKGTEPPLYVENDCHEMDVPLTLNGI